MLWNDVGTSGMPAPSGQIPSTLGVVGERGSRHEGRMRPDLGGKVMLVPTFH